MDQMMGNLFIAQKMSPNEIEEMTISRMVYWHKWHKIADNAQIDETKRLENLAKLGK